MPYLQPLPREAMSDEQRRVHDAIASSPRGGVRGPFPALLRRPELAERVANLGSVIRYGTPFEPRLLELAILVTAHSVRCELEWHSHSEQGLKDGLSEELIEAIRVGAEPTFADDDERIVHDFAREVQQDHAVSSDTYEAALRRFGELGVVDLAAIVGYFAMVATTINAHGLVWAPDLASPFEPRPRPQQS